MSSTISDAELRRLALRLDDAYAQPGVIPYIPEGAELVTILNLYRHKHYPRDKVYCPVCGGHRHRDGFTVLLSNGKRALLGSTCGEYVFGESWKEAEKRLTEATSRQYELYKADRAVMSLPLFLKALQGWRQPTEYLAARHQVFQRRYGYLWSALQAIRNTPAPRLTVSRRVRDYAAEARRPSNSRDNSPIWTYEEKPFGILRGPGFFDDIDIVGKLDIVREAATEYLALARDTQSNSTIRIKKARLRFDRVSENLREVYRLRREADEFFTPSNLKVVVAWAAAQDSRTRSGAIAEGAMLTCENTGSKLRVDDLRELDTDVFDFLAEYRRAD